LGSETFLSILIMGILRIIKDYEESQLKLRGVKYEGLDWCELGNQDFDGQPAKDIYESEGVSHTSIDLNGLDGALSLDLSQPIDLKKKFDVITNYGTTEHCCDQYECFKNIHIFCKKGGIMIHGVPLVGNWRKHGRYYYSEKFFRELASACKYEVQDFQVLNKDYYQKPRNLVLVVFVKRQANSFISKEKFQSIQGLFDSGDISKTQNYTQQ